MAKNLSIDVWRPAEFSSRKQYVTFYGARRRLRHPRVQIFDGSGIDDDGWANGCFSHVPQFRLVANEFNRAVARQKLVPDGPVKDRAAGMLQEVFDNVKGYIPLQRTAAELMALRADAVDRLDDNTRRSATAKNVELRKQQVALLDSLQVSIGLVEKLQAGAQSPEWLLAAEKVLAAAAVTQREVQLLDSTPTKTFLASVDELAKDKVVQDTEDMCNSVREHVARTCA